jgi:oxygen-independent coproporphyrinogen-3 oxidase
LVADVRRRELPAASSVFVGGGTPTRVAPELLAEVLRSVPVGRDAEITVECNPDDVTVDMFVKYAEAGVNRVSLGVQSMVPHVLDTLGRRHRPENVERAVAAAGAAGIGRVNIDLIYGAQGESLDDWAASVQATLALGVRHVSAYALTVEAGTPLAADPTRHPDDDDLADKYELADELFQASGLEMCRPRAREGSSLLEYSHPRSMDRCSREWRIHRCRRGASRRRRSANRRFATRLEDA